MNTEIHTLGRAQVFSLSEANLLLDTVMKVTKPYYEKISTLEERMQKLLLADPRRREYQIQFTNQVTEWKRKMEGLGLHVQGLWKLKFDVGEGFLCWEYPELTISHFMQQGQTWKNRLKLLEYIEFNDPDWAID